MVLLFVQLVEGLIRERKLSSLCVISVTRAFRKVLNRSSLCSRRSSEGKRGRRGEAKGKAEELDDYPCPRGEEVRLLRCSPPRFCMETAFERSFLSVFAIEHPRPPLVPRIKIHLCTF